MPVDLRFRVVSRISELREQDACAGQGNRVSEVGHNRRAENLARINPESD
jgi:hypothetical protein